MATEINEAMELNDVNDREEFDSEMDTCEGSGLGKVIALALVGAGVVGTGATVLYKNLKAKKADKADKPKTKKRLKWVDIPVEETEEIVNVEAEVAEETKEPKGKKPEKK